jgi:hypothetical protein
MKGLSFVGLLAVVAIIGFAAKSQLQPVVSHDPNNKATVEYWVAHEGDRTSMVAWCQQHPQSQDSADCTLAIAAQTQVDARAQQGSAQSNQTGTDQASGDANDQLQAQQNANTLDSGQP